MMTAYDPPSGTIESHPSRQSLRGLDWFDLFLAGVLTGFGPFVTLHLAKQSWTKEDIGFILTISVLAGWLVQVPSGELLDMVRSKRLACQRVAPRHGRQSPQPPDCLRVAPVRHTRL
jgi:hypothetical protein